MKILTAALFGIVFGVGLLISGMTDPARVLAFLDVTGAWNPALALVMGAAVLVAAPAYAVVRRKGVDALGEPVTLPHRFRIDVPLLAGAAIFGVGWGLSGLCPGPSLVVLGEDWKKAGTFVLALVLGAWIVRLARQTGRDGPPKA